MREVSESSEAGLSKELVKWSLVGVGRRLDSLLQMTSDVPRRVSTGKRVQRTVAETMELSVKWELGREVRRRSGSRLLETREDMPGRRGLELADDGVREHAVCSEAGSGRSQAGGKGDPPHPARGAPARWRVPWGG